MNTKPNEELEKRLKTLMVDCIDDSNITESNLLHFTNYNDDFTEFLQLIQTEIAEAERRAVLKELKAIWNETQHDILPVGLEPVEYTASVVLRRIKQLTEIEVSHGKGLDPEPTITGKIDPIVGEEVKVEKPYKITEIEVSGEGENANS